MTRYAKKYRRIARRLGRIDLMASSVMQPDLDSSSWVASFDDEAAALASASFSLVGGDDARRGPRRFLDFYGDEGVILALHRYGIDAAVQRRGYTDLKLQLFARDERHTMVLDATHPDLSEPARLLELVVRRDRLVPTSLPNLQEEFEVLTVDWLLLQDPAGTFAEKRPRLPGQDTPGLGLAEHALEMLYRITDRLKLEGLVTSGEYFHNAVMYSRELSFIDVESAGVFIALKDALLRRERLNLAEASWAIENGRVRRVGATEPFVWRGDAQVRAHNPVLREFITGKERRRLVLEHATQHSFELLPET